jgi:translocation and assembly module TamB
MQTPLPATVYFSFIDLFNNTRWQLETSLAQFKPAELFADWPPLRIRNASLKLVGDLEGYQGSLHGEELVWEGVWPADQEAMGVNATGNTTGTAPVTGGDNFPGIPVAAEFTGDSKGLKLSALTLKLPEQGRIVAQGGVDWQELVNWEFTLTSSDLDPRPFFPDWQGRINATIHHRGQWGEEAFSADTELLSLAGEWFGAPLTGGGSVRMVRKGLGAADTPLEIQALDLLLQSGASKLRISGEAGPVLDMRMQLESDDLGALWPQAGGNISVQAQALGERDEPRISFEFNGHDLSHRENRAQSLQGEGNGVLSRQGALKLRLVGEGGQLGPLPFSSLRAELDGTMASHQMQVALQGKSGDLKMEVAGGYDEKISSWQGAVRTLSLQAASFGKWQLQEEAPVSLAQEKAALTGFCLRHAGAVACADGEWQSEGQMWRLNASLDSFEAGLLSQWGLLFQPVTGVINSSLHLGGKGGLVVSGSLDIGAPELRFAFLDEDGQQQRLQWTENKVHLELSDSRLVGLAQAHFHEGGALDASWTLDHIGDLSAPWLELPMQGEIGLDIQDLETLALLLNPSEIVRPKGALQGRFALSGQPGNPQINGELRQTGGALAFPAAGIALENLRLHVNRKGEEQETHLLLEAESGPGNLAFTGVVERKEGTWQMDGSFTGHDFVVADRPDLVVHIDPDLQVQVRDGVVQIGGKVLVPKAFVAINTVDESVTASRDVRVMDAEDEKKKLALPLRGSALIELGEEVGIDSFGLQGQVRGRVTIADLATWPPSGKGELLLQKGMYVIRERTLDISRGRFFFLGGSLSNPGIDVLAQKKVKNKVVGVLVSGTVNDMDLKLFSDPPLPESQILTELLAGQPLAKKKSPDADGASSPEERRPVHKVVGNIFSQLEDQFALNNIYMEQGSQYAGSSRSSAQTSDISVMIGRELFTDLFISYGYDPFRADGIFKARYDLWKGFSVETEVGAEQTGADLLWSIEK